MDIARQGCNRPAPLVAGQDQWESFLPSFDITTDPPVKTAAANTAPTVYLTSDQGDNEDDVDLRPSPRYTRRTKNLPYSRHLPHASSDRSTNHNASVFTCAPHVSPVPPSIKVEELHISVRATRPASPQLPKALRNDVPDLLTEEHVPLLRRFFRLVIGRSSNDFACTLAKLARQLWDLMEAHRTCREYSTRTVKAASVDLVSPPGSSL